MNKYSVKRVAEIFGVSIRTLHHYDRRNLLNPAVRTGSGYRYYSEQELYRLQQILFYKEIGYELKEIKNILDEPDFDLMTSLEYQKKKIIKERERLGVLISTINKTITTLKGEKDIDTYEDLYEGFTKEQIRNYLEIIQIRGCYFVHIYIL